MMHIGPYETDTNIVAIIQVAYRRFSLDGKVSFNIWIDRHWYWHSFAPQTLFATIEMAKQDLDNCLISKGYTIIDDPDRWEKLKLLV